jgi:hypothetical protein
MLSPDLGARMEMKRNIGGILYLFIGFEMGFLLKVFL